MNTQRGNNNPYNQDNEISWLDWERLERNRDMFRFFKRMIAFRKAHPSISRSRFWRDDVCWYGVHEAPDLGFHSHSLAYCLRGANLGDDDLYVMINAYWETLRFTVQEGTTADWCRVIDTSRASPDDILETEAQRPLDSLQYDVRPRSIVVLRGRLRSQSSSVTLPSRSS